MVKIVPCYYEMLCHACIARQALRCARKGVDIEALEAAWNRIIAEERVARH